MPLQQKKNMNSILDCITSVASKWSEGILPLYSALARPPLELCVYFWALQYKRDLDILG